MKQFLVLVVSLTLIANSNCGFFDTVIGTVKDTTKSITHGVGDVVHRSKNFVFGGTEQNAAGQVVIKPGIVGTISHKIHDVSASAREEVRTVIHWFDGDQVHEKGIIGRLFDRVKCRVFKIKNFFSGNGHIGQAQVGHAQSGHVHLENRPNPLQLLKNDTGMLSEKLRKYFFNKNSPATSGIRQTLTSLHEAIDRIRFNITRKRQESGNENSEQDGSGLIDIRTSANSLGGLQNDFEHGVDAAYDKVGDAIDEGRQTAQSSFNRAQLNTNDFIEDQKRNVQNHYNQMANNADRFRSDVGSSVNDNIENQRRNVQNHYNQITNNADRLRSDVSQSVTENIESQRRNLQSHYNRFNNNADRFRIDVGDSIGNVGQYVTDNIENQRRNVQYPYDQFGNNADRLKSDVGSSLSDIGVRLGDETSKVKDLMQNAYSEVDYESQNLGRGY